MFIPIFNYYIFFCVYFHLARRFGKGWYEQMSSLRMELKIEQKSATAKISKRLRGLSFVLASLKL